MIGAMQTLGFNANEARAWVGLVKAHPATGYELAARTSVPRSAIYGVLKRLEASGLVHKVGDQPARFAPLPAERLLDLLETRFTRDLGTLRDALEELHIPHASAATWSVEGYDSILSEARTLIRRSERSVHASLWRREAVLLAPVIGEAVARGVDVLCFSFTDLPEGIGQVLSYGIPEPDLEPHWPHRLTLVADGRRALVGGGEPSKDTRAVVTDERPLVETAVSNLVLDVTLYGQRRGEDVGAVIEGLTRYLAPIDELLAAHS